MSNVAVETQESVVMLPEIASSMARLATSSKMARRTLRQVHLVTLTRKPDTSSHVFAITQNQTTNISGHVVPAEGIAMDPAKVEAVTKWPRPTSETEAHSFLKLADHYHRVFEGFSRLALPLTKLTRKDEKLYGSESKRRSLKNQEIVRLHGTPSAIVSDKDPRFTFRILETHARQEGYTNKLSRPLKFTAKLSCFLESIAYEWRQTSHEYHSFHVISYPHDQIREDLSHLNEPESILNCQDIVMRNKTISFCQDFLEEPFFFSVVIFDEKKLGTSGGGLILYQAYGNLYAMTGRKAHLLEDKQILSVGVFDETKPRGLELPEGNNVVPLRFDTIRLVQNGCSFHGLWSEDPNQHLKYFLKLVDSLDLDSENRERTRLHLFQFSLRDQASNWLERLPAGSISTWDDLTTRFRAQFFPPRRTTKLRNDILMFQQHHGESLSEAWTRFKDLLQKVPHHGIDLWLQLRDLNPEEYWAILEHLALYDNESWNDPRDFAKPVKAIELPQDVPSTFDRRLIKLENQVQRLMEAHLASTQPTQVNKITTLCEIYSGPHDTQCCMENPE
ncbi:MAK10-like protein [Tanacetum coccineum]